MGYDRGDSFLFDLKPNGIPFGSKSNGKLSPRSCPIKCERKWKYSFLSAHTEKSFPNLVNLNQIWIVIFPSASIDLPPIGVPIGVLNLSENGLITIQILFGVIRFRKIFLCVHHKEERKTTYGYL